jgi:hypothetical protein
MLLFCVGDNSLPTLRFLIGTKTKFCILTAAFALILSGFGNAEGLNTRAYHPNNGSVVSIRTVGGTYAIGASAWHTGPRQRAIEQPAPKAKIIDVKAALANPTCVYQNNVCILRLHPNGSL